MDEATMKDVKNTSGKKRTAIYGGSFNPIHLGHTSLGDWLCQEGYVEELWFLVSPLNPLKQQDTTLLDDAARLDLARLAVEEKSTLRVSDFEMHMPRPSYMVHTLEALRSTYPDREFVLRVVADICLAVPGWYQAEESVAQHTLWVYPREGYDIDPATLPQGVQLVNAPLYPISSTDIRHAIAHGTGQGEWLHPKLCEEIHVNCYYN